MIIKRNKWIMKKIKNKNEKNECWDYKIDKIIK